LSTATLTPTPETADSTVCRQYAPIPFTSVTIEDSFWAPKRAVNRERTIPHIYRQLLETGRIDAFRPDWQPGPEITARGAGWGARRDAGAAPNSRSIRWAAGRPRPIPWRWPSRPSLDPL